MTDEKKSFLEKFANKKPTIEKIKDKKPALEEHLEKSDSPEAHEKIIDRDKNNFMDHLIKSRADMCYQVMGRDITGRVAWYFILADKEKREQFLAHKPGDSYDLADYGKVIASGYGEEVPQDVKDMLKEKYGFDNF